MSTNNRKPARGEIVELRTYGGGGDDIAIATLRDGSILAIEYDAAGPIRAAVRAAEVETLERDPYLKAQLADCVNMDERRKVLKAICAEGWTVTGTPKSEPDPNLQKILDEDDEPTPTPQGLPDLSKLNERLEALAGTLIAADAALAERIDTLTPTQITVAGHDPVTLPAEELVHCQTQEVIEDMQDGMHVYLTGEPGVGKSRMAATIAKSFGFDKDKIHFFSCSNMDQKNSLLGYNSPVGAEYNPGPIHWAWREQFVFLDEMDAAMGAAMTATNAGLDSPLLTFPNGETLERPDELFILAAGNTTGKGGDMLFMRNQMDAATRNRWVFHHIDSDPAIERAVVEPILGDMTSDWLTHCWGVRDALSTERVVFSTRNIVNGAKMLRRNRPIETIIERALLPGESADIVRKSGARDWRG